MKGLVHKELRDVLPIVALALLAYLAIVAWPIAGHVFPNLRGLHKGREVPFLGHQFLGYFVLVSAAFALLLGFRQSAWEEIGGRYLFLLHRPLPRKKVFLVKLATGASAFAACASVPILLYGAWAALPGTHPSPFAWSMTLPSWGLVYALVPLYLGAFLSGLYPARWYGTRLLPLFASAFLVFLAWVLLDRFWYVCIPALALLAGLLTASICYVAQQRDYA